MTPDPHGDRDSRHSWPLPGGGERRHRELFSTRMIVGVLIMLLGATLLADNLGWIEARHVLRSLWPLVMVAIGVSMVRRPQHRRGREAGWVLITVGIWIFLSKLGWVHVSLGQLLLPGIFLFVGGVLVFRSLRGPEDAAAKSKLDDAGGEAA